MHGDGGARQLGPYDAHESPQAGPARRGLDLPPDPIPQDETDAAASRLRMGIFAVSALLVVTVAMLAMSHPKSATPAPVVVTQTNLVSPSPEPELPRIDLNRSDPGGGVIATELFGTVALPADQTIESGGDAAAIANVRLWSGIEVNLGSMQMPTATVDAMADQVRAWASRNQLASVIDLGAGAVETSALGFTGWCAPVSRTDGSAGRACFYPTIRGSTFIWVWTTGSGGSATDIQTILDHYVPGP